MCMMSAALSSILASSICLFVCLMQRSTQNIGIMRIVIGAHSPTEFTVNSALSRYIAAFFLRINHERHPIVRPSGPRYRVSIVSARSDWSFTWWRHEMETFSALLAICAGNSPVPGEFPAQRPVTRSFDVFVDLLLNKRLSKQPWSWWFETPSRPLWRHRNAFATVALCTLSSYIWQRYIDDMRDCLPGVGIKSRIKYLYPTVSMGCNYLSPHLTSASGI